MNLLLITYEYPYGTGETYIETEIEYASKYFERVYIISLSKSLDKTRNVPSNVEVLKADKYYRFCSSILFAFWKLFSVETINELKNLKRLEYSPKLSIAIKQWLKSRMICRRIDCAVKKMNIPSNTIGYSYWLSEGAYYLSKNKSKFTFTISRAHGYELRDDEVYLPFRTVIQQNIDEIAFISENAKRQYDRITKLLPGCNVGAKHRIFRLGVKKGLEKSEEKCDDNVFRIVSCSAIYPLKRLDLIVDSLALLPNDTFVEWIHFGWGIDGEKTRKYCQDRFLNKKNIQWEFKGNVSNEYIKNFYASNSVSLFINTSDMEGIPVSIMEAESFGIPAIARAVGGNPEVVKYPHGILLSSDALPEEIAEAINGVYTGKIKINRDDILNFFEKEYLDKNNYDNFYSELL